MRTLNIHALRDLSTKLGGSLTERKTSTVSRRSFLKLGATASAATASRLVRFSEFCALNNEISVAWDRDSFRVLISGEEKFLIDAKSFCDKASLHVNNSERSVELALRNARFAGSLLSADLDCELWRGALGWRIRLGFTRLGTTFNGYLVDWLNGENLCSSLRSAAEVFHDGSNSLRLTACRVSFSRDWKLRFSGHPAGHATIAGQELPFAHADFWHMPLQVFNWISTKAKRRSLLKAERMEYQWGVEGPSPPSGRWDYTRDRNFFDDLWVEAAETAEARSTHAFVVIRDSTRPGPEIVAAPQFVGSDGRPLELKLTNIRYAISNSGESKQSAFMADLADGDSTVQLGPMSLFFKNPDNAPAVEILQEGPQQTEKVAPAYSMQAALPGEVVISEKLPGFATLPLTWNPKTWPKIWCEIEHGLHLTGDEHRACLTGPFRFSVLRPDDFLSLEIEFRGVNFQCHRSETWIERQSAAIPSLMIVRFPSQVLLEEAFISSEPVATFSCSSSGAARPAAAKLSKRSRIVFELFKDHPDKLRLNLDTILKWAGLPIKVSEAALCSTDGAETCVHADYAGADGPTMPSETETAIEMPARLIVSPHQLERFETSVEARGSRHEDDSRYELWTAALIPKGEPVPSDGSQMRPTVRAVAYRDGKEVQSLSITKITRLNNVVTVTTAAPHGVAAGRFIEIEGVRDASFNSNGVNVASVSSVTVLTFKQEGANADSAGGTVKVPMWPVSNSERHAIVDMFTKKGLTQLPGPTPYHPQPMSLDYLFLSAAGGWMRGDVTWPAVKESSLESWKESISTAREHLDELSYRGFLFPTGHRVTLQKTTRRQWCEDSYENAAAYLITRFKVIIRERTRSYEQLKGFPANGRQLPFRSIRITIGETPFLCAGDQGRQIGAKSYLDSVTSWEDAKRNHLPLPAAPGVYWPTVQLPNGTCSYVMFPLDCEDHEGHVSTCQIPMIVVLGGTAFDGAIVGKVFQAYEVGPRSCDFGNQQIAYGPPNQPGDTSFHTRAFSWQAVHSSTLSIKEMEELYQPPWFPVMEKASLAVEALQRFAKNPTPGAFSYGKEYLAQGFNVDSTRIKPWASQTTVSKGTWIIDPINHKLHEVVTEGTTGLNPAWKTAAEEITSDGSVTWKCLGSLNKGEVLLAALDQSLYEVKGEVGGGIAGLDSKVQGLSRRLGVISGEIKAFENSVKGVFDGADSFSKSLSLPNAKILGVIELAEVLAPISDVVREFEKVPKLVSEKINDAKQGIEGATEKLQAVVSGIQQIADILSADPVAAVRNQLATYVKEFVWTQASIRFLLLEERVSDEILSDWKKLSDDPSFKEQIRQAYRASQAVLDLWASLPGRIEAAKISVAERLGDPSCLNKASSLAQVKECLIAVATRKAVASNQFQALSGFVVQGLARLNELQQTVEGIVDIVQHHPIVRLRDAVLVLSDKLQHLSGIQDLAGIESGVNGLIEALSALAPTDIKQNAGAWVDDEKRSIQEGADKVLTEAKTTTDKFLEAAQGIQNSLNAEYAEAQSTVSAIQSGVQALTANLVDKLKNGVWEQWWSVFSSVSGQLKAAQKNLRDLQEEAQGLLRAIRIPSSINVTYSGTPRLQDAPPDNPVLKASLNGQAAELRLNAVMTAYLDGRSPTFRADAVMTNFTMRLFPGLMFLELPFKSFSFHSEPNASPRFEAEVGKPKFLGPLNFVEKLQESLSFPNKGRNGPYVELLGDGIAAGLRLALPPIQAGAFTLKNVSFSSGVKLSFFGKPALVRFGFAEDSHRFLMAYSIFGGGGFFLLESGLKEIIALRGALEFGAVAELNLGVAQGGVHFFGGFYFESGRDHCVLKGFLRAGGELNILGIASVTVEFMLGLSYENRGGQAWLVGECVLTVEIDILFFSVSVELRLRREFSGSSAGQGQSVRKLQTPNQEFAALTDSKEPSALDHWYEKELRRYAC